LEGKENCRTVHLAVEDNTPLDILQVDHHYRTVMVHLTLLLHQGETPMDETLPEAFPFDEMFPVLAWRQMVAALVADRLLHNLDDLSVWSWKVHHVDRLILEVSVMSDPRNVVEDVLVVVPTYYSQTPLVVVVVLQVRHKEDNAAVHNTTLVVVVVHHP
jgi:hypothetical protein